LKKLLSISVLLLLAAIMLFTSCGGGTTTTAPPTTVPTTAPPTSVTPTGPTGTITVASVDFGYESMDPVFYESLWGQSWYDSLLRWDENGIFIPGVADSWSVSENGCDWTFKIHQGIKFHNGDPLTSADVKWTVDRFGDMSLSSNPWSYYISDIYNKIGSYCPDDYTFVFKSAKPEPAQQIVFAWTRILPKAYYESVGKDGFAAAPIGSGPWKFKELITKQKMTIEANTEYWRPDEIPAYQYYTELMVPEQATRIAMLKNGEVDIALGIDYDRLPDLKAAGFTVMTQPGPPGTSSLCILGSWLPDAGPVSDIRVRKALSYSLDRQEIVDTWYQGYGDATAGQFYMYPGCFGWDEGLRCDTFDLDLAQALMREAGYPGKWADPTIHIFTTAAGQDYILMLMGYWEAAGLQVQLEVLDSTIYTSYFFNFTRIKEGDPNVGWIFTWSYQSFFNCMYHSSNMYTSWGVHNVGQDPVIDKLYLKAANEKDPVKSAQYFGEFQVAARAMYWNIGVCVFDTLIVYNSKTIGAWTGRNWVGMADALAGIQHP
jgi:peptide/nickel transport system substrate-binding protein